MIRLAVSSEERLLTVLKTWWKEVYHVMEVFDRPGSPPWMHPGGSGFEAVFRGGNPRARISELLRRGAGDQTNSRCPGSGHTGLNELFTLGFGKLVPGHRCFVRVPVRRLCFIGFLRPMWPRLISTYCGGKWGKPLKCSSRTPLFLLSFEVLRRIFSDRLSVAACSLFVGFFRLAEVTGKDDGFVRPF